MNTQKLKSLVPSFLKRFKQKHFTNHQSNQQQKKTNNNQNSVSIIQSDTLGMTIIQDDENINQFSNMNHNNHQNNNNNDKNQQIQILSPEQWVLIIQNGNLKGFSFTRIYYSLLKGIPDYLRLKIWLFFCTENATKNFKFTVKQLPKELVQKYPKNKTNKNKQSKQESIQQEYIEITQITTQLYLQLLQLQPLQKQKTQIDKDVHRTYSKRVQYKYTDSLLRKILYALSNSGIQYSQGMNYILLNVIIYCLQSINIRTSESFPSLTPYIQSQIFCITRQIVTRMSTIFSQNNIFKVISQLQQKIAQSIPQILYLIYSLGMDCFSMFSQYYFSLFSYNNPPDELCKQMMDLFFIGGEKAIHAIIVKMLEVSKEKILKNVKTAEGLNQFLKVDMFQEYYHVFIKEKKCAKNLKDFGMSFYQTI